MLIPAIFEDAFIETVGFGVVSIDTALEAACLTDHYRGGSFVQKRFVAVHSYFLSAKVDKICFLSDISMT